MLSFAERGRNLSDCLIKSFSFNFKREQKYDFQQLAPYMNT
jgi:hypothetical protein